MILGIEYRKILTTKKGLRLESFFHVRGVLVLISNEPCI